MLAGAPKSGKSWLGLQLAFAVAAGTAPAGTRQACEQAPAHAFALDDRSERRVQRRLDAIGGAKPWPRDLTYWTQGVSRGTAFRDDLARYLDRHPTARLVVIDTLEYVRADKSMGDSHYRADVKALDTIRQVHDQHPDVTVLCLAHTRKGDDDDPLEAVSGTHGVSGGADAVLVLTGKRGTGRRQLDVIGRDDDDRTMVMTLTANGLTLTADDPNDPAALMTPPHAAVYRHMQAFGVPVAPSDVQQALPDVPNVKNIMLKLHANGHVVKVGRGLYAVD